MEKKDALSLGKHEIGIPWVKFLLGLFAGICSAFSHG
jgi:hypothetical protein